MAEPMSHGRSGQPASVAQLPLPPTTPQCLASRSPSSQNLHLTLPHGRTTAVVGLSGAGEQRGRERAVAWGWCRQAVCEGPTVGTRETRGTVRGVKESQENAGADCGCDSDLPRAAQRWAHQGLLWRQRDRQSVRGLHSPCLQKVPEQRDVQKWLQGCIHVGTCSPHSTTARGLLEPLRLIGLLVAPRKTFCTVGWRLARQPGLSTY